MSRFIVWLFIIVSILTFYVWQQTQSVRLGYNVDNLRRECETWDQKNKALRLDVNRLLSLERLDQVSKNKNLMHPKEKDIIYLEQ